MVADALSRRPGAKVEVPNSAQSDLPISGSSVSTILDVSLASKGILCIISFPTPSWLSDLKRSYTSNPKI